MKLESKIEEKPAARSYPYLGEHERTGAIVLFNKPNTGGEAVTRERTQLGVFNTPIGSVWS